MTQLTTTPEGVENEAGSTNAVPSEVQALIDAIKLDPAKTAEEIKSLRAEAKQRRLSEAAAERAKAKAEADKLEVDQQWQKAAEKYKQQLDALAPLAEQLAAMKETIAATVQGRIDQLPKDKRGLVPEYDDPARTLAWLERNASALNLPVVPNVGAGQQGDVAAAPPKGVLDALSTAQQMGMSAAEVAEMKNFLTKQPK